MFKARKLIRRLLHEFTEDVGEDRGGANREQGQVRASLLFGAGESEPGVEALSGMRVEEEAGGAR